MKTHTSIEPLEPRIAPAAITILGKTATWTDHDGDLVTMKWSSTDAPAFTKVDTGLGLLVSRILLDPGKHVGASFTVTVKAGGTFGDGRVELGHLDGDGVALKSWVGAKAAISEIDLGENTNAIGTLIMGGLGQTKIAAFTGAMGDGFSALKGSTKMVKINGDVTNNVLTIGNFNNHTNGSITITGDVRSLPSSISAEVFVGKAKSFTIGGSIVLDARVSTGAVDSLSILGDISRGSLSTLAKTIAIRGSVLDGTIRAAGAKSIVIGGSLIAQQFSGRGKLTVTGDTGSITIKGSVVGLSVPNVDGVDIDNQGAVLVHSGAIVGETGSGRPTIKSITIGGNIIAGVISNSTPGINGGIYSEGSIGKIAVGGSLIGNIKTPVNILVRGIAPSTPGDYNGIGSITVKGSAVHAYIASGTQLQGITGTFVFGPATRITPNPDAGIGSVKIGGNYMNSNIFAGVADGAALGVESTNVGDTLGVGDAARSAKLGPVVIKGHLLSDRDAEYSGFAADAIASITVNGRKVFTAGDGLRNFDTFITAKEL